MSAFFGHPSRCWFLSLLLAIPVLSAPVRFAIIGDFGSGNADEQSVANLVGQMQVAFVVTTGDNTYGNPANYAHYVGDYYGDYLKGSPEETNRFWPALGNHDWFSGSGYGAYLNYFELPGNERYYDLIRGPVHFFFVNSDEHEPDGVDQNSVQALWLSNHLASSTAIWNIVIIHHAPYSSTGESTASRWPFRAWGADAVVSGHSHNYERLEVDGLTYFVNGIGGSSRQDITQPRSDSQFSFAAAPGAMVVVADEATIEFQFYSAQNGGTLLDSHRLTSPVAIRMAIRPCSEGMILSWPGLPDRRYDVQAREHWTSNSTWTSMNVETTHSNTHFSVTMPALKQTHFYRVVDLGGMSP